MARPSSSSNAEPARRAHTHRSPLPAPASRPIRTRRSSRAPRIATGSRPRMHPQSLAIRTRPARLTPLGSINVADGAGLLRRPRRLVVERRADRALEHIDAEGLGDERFAGGQQYLVVPGCLLIRAPKK